MEVLVNNPFDFAVLAEGEMGYVVVVCGTSALFDVWIKKPRSEINALLSNQSALRSLVDATRLNPKI
ncbi:hypothetical protein GCM10025770_12690 [Viridibacterium curvum]|uniref:Uncharacterized protein n=1 Tax=Viridibacterium curvum TaxID=1101404 RepID=A0ABP9QI59_9RHOO